MRQKINSPLSEADRELLVKAIIETQQAFMAWTDLEVEEMVDIAILAGWKLGLDVQWWYLGSTPISCPPGHPEEPGTEQKDVKWEISEWGCSVHEEGLCMAYAAWWDTPSVSLPVQWYQKRIIT